MGLLVAGTHGQWYRSVLFHRNGRAGGDGQLGIPRRGKRDERVYDSLTEFMKNFSVDHSVLWALLVMAVVATAGLALFAFWELVLNFPRNGRILKKISRRFLD